MVKKFFSYSTQHSLNIEIPNILFPRLFSNHLCMLTFDNKVHSYEWCGSRASLLLLYVPISIMLKASIFGWIGLDWKDTYRKKKNREK